MKYYQQKDGEWVQPKDNYRIACCDCGLVHDMQFRVVKGNVQFSATRNNRSTAARRRGIKK